MASNAQYQHFIPQFMLKNFSHPFVCLDGGSPDKKCKKHNHKKGKYPGDAVMNSVDLMLDPFIIEESPVSRTCGLWDMYDDVTKSNPNEKRNIEKKFSALEAEKDVLRKFTFILRYRGSGLHKQYHHEDVETYNDKNQHLLRSYMKQRGFARPFNVWLHNLETMIDLEMDPGMYLTICTPAELNEEFILTENSYNVWEGPNRWDHDPTTGESTRVGALDLHEFAPVSPKLMLVSRSNLLPEALGGSNPKARAERESEWQARLKGIFDPNTKSMLHDLPVGKARNDYSAMVNGRIEIKPDWDGKLRNTDRFYFPFFRIPTSDVQKINGLLLDRAFNSSRIMFGHQNSLLDLLQWFLEEPCEVGKRIESESADRQIKYLKNLGELVKSLGQDVNPVWIEPPTTTAEDMEIFKLMERLMRGGLDL
ncbi:hypothetical protein PT974_07226 [Cladobotryum mycophilum]|uniref:DUF4238 domain-containing protein n=1 Tax=Cladobotryum mycophilum TaxID=491253 RepID=A0ABR0SNP6_9HYPO